MFCAFQQPDVIAEEPQRQELAEQAGGHGRRVFLAERSGSKLVLMIMGRLAIRRLLIRLYSAETVKAVHSVPISSIMSRSARS